MTFSTPQDAEDAFYDAIEDNNHTAMMKVWADTADAICLLPMHPVSVGIASIRESWLNIMKSNVQTEVYIKHLHWTAQQQWAIHLVEETICVGPNKEKQPPIYGTNVYRKEADGWRLLTHINAPTPVSAESSPTVSFDPASLPPELRP